MHADVLQSLPAVCCFICQNCKGERSRGRSEFRDTVGHIHFHTKTLKYTEVNVMKQVIEMPDCWLVKHRMRMQLSNHQKNHSENYEFTTYEILVDTDHIQSWGTKAAASSLQALSYMLPLLFNSGINVVILFEKIIHSFIHLPYLNCPKVWMCQSILYC